MKKILIIAIIAFTSVYSLFANGTTETGADAVTTASIVTDGTAFAKGVSKDGTWIVAALNDITVNGDLTVEGDFLKDGKPYRKLALYTQDENRKVTASFTLTADHLIVKSEHTRIQNGTFKGDVIVEAKDFELTNSKVTGNIYFATEELLSTFKKDDASSVSGTVGVKM